MAAASSVSARGPVGLAGDVIAMLEKQSCATTCAGRLRLVLSVTPVKTRAFAAMQ